MVRRTLTAVSAVVGLFLYGSCSSTQNDATPGATSPGGKVGESCQSRRDCESALSCIDLVCVEGAGGADAGDELLGRLGESCGSRSDCVRGLSCVNQVCVNPEQKEDAGPPPRSAGTRGESCGSHVDCAAGLTCVRNVCTPVDLGIDPTGKECVKVQCKEATDCCGVEGVCPARRRECMAGVEASCKIFEDICKCPTTDRWTCTDSQCVAVAAPRATCSLEAGAPCSMQDGGFIDGYCNGATCVECLQAAHCASKLVCSGKLCNCVEEKCTPVCANDLDCPGMQKCRNNKCVDAPCTTNRECVAFTSNPFSLCDQGKCRTSCVGDGECNDATLRNLQVCVNGYCQEAGCETRDECKILLLKQGTVLSTLLDVECRAKK